MISPSSFAVRALKFLQKSMMFTPCGPSAVPTGGAGVALPAAIWSFTIACIFFAIVHNPATFKTAQPQRTRGTRSVLRGEKSNFFHLQKIELDRCRSSEDGQHHL